MGVHVHYVPIFVVKLPKCKCECIDTPLTLGGLSSDGIIDIYNYCS